MVLFNKKNINKVRCLFISMFFCFFFTLSVNPQTEPANEGEIEIFPYAIDLEKIVITPSKIEQSYMDSTQNISIISNEEIESSRVLEVTELLDLVASLDVLEYGSIGSTRSVHIRGASSAQVLTLVDGRPLNTPRDGMTDFNQISLSNIERIEVLRGPASSMYGANAVGGVINIITKKGTEKMHTQVSKRIGSFSTNLLSLTHGYKIKDFDYFISYDYSSSHGHRDNADYLNNNINTKLGYQFNENNRISVSSGYQNYEAGSPGKVTNQDLDDKQESYKKYVDISYDGKLFKEQDVSLKLFHNFDRLEFIRGFNPIDKDTHQVKVYGLNAQISQNFSDDFRTAIGFSYQGHRLNSSTSSKHAYNLKGIYIESEAKFFEKVFLKGGLRWDDYSNFGDRLSPSISSNFWPSDKIKMHALVAKSFRAPTFNDLYWPRDEDWQVEGNPALGPEKATSYESGITAYFLKNLKVDFTFFKTIFNNLIEWTVDDSSWVRPDNVSTASTKGAELEAEFILKENMRANFSYTYLEAKNRITKKWLIYRPQHLYKLKIAYSPVSKFETVLTTIYKTKRFTNASNTSFLKHYFVMNVNSSYKINDSVEVLFEIKNVFDRNYQEQKDYSLPGRAFYGGMKFTF